MERPSRLRIYSEMLPYEGVVRPRTLALLARYRLELVLAVRPWDAEALPDVARHLRDAGIPLSIWPMLADESGRWANVHNAESFSRFVLALSEALEDAQARPVDVLLDLEPPFAQASSLAAVGEGHPSGIFGALSRRPPPAAVARAQATLASTVETLRERAITTSLAVWPLVALDPLGAMAWQSLLGTPVDGLASSHVSVMVYTSIFEGWSRGALRRRDATELLAAATARTVRRWGALGGISLGCVGTGAFADEPVYRGPAELAEDVLVTHAAGCSNLALFDLAGVLAREPAEAWLDAFTAPPVALAERAPSRRVRVARTMARAATRMLLPWREGARRPR